MLKIQTPTERSATANIVALIYAAPGTGKTTLAQSCNKPLLLDFDLGQKRTKNACNSVAETNWKEYMGLTQAELLPFDTIIIDTAGKCVMSIYDYTTKDKAMSQSDGAPTMKGWQFIASQFNDFIKRLQSFGKDIVFIAHAKEQISDKINTIRPDILGSALNRVYEVCDFMGYLNFQGTNRVLSCAPCESYVTKDSAQLGDILVPTISVIDKLNENFFATVLDKVKDSFCFSTAQNELLITQTNTELAKIANAVDANELNMLVEHYTDAEIDLMPSVVLQCKKAIHTKATEMGLTFNKDTKEYELPNISE